MGTYLQNENNIASSTTYGTHLEIPSLNSDRAIMGTYLQNENNIASSTTYRAHLEILSLNSDRAIMGTYLQNENNHCIEHHVWRSSRDWSLDSIRACVARQ